MAYDQKVIFEVKKSLDDDEKQQYVFDNCLFGWFVKDEELFCSKGCKATYLSDMKLSW